jgi:hypothetical protein
LSIGIIGESFGYGICTHNRRKKIENRSEGKKPEIDSIHIEKQKNLGINHDVKENDYYFQGK